MLKQFSVESKLRGVYVALTVLHAAMTVWVFLIPEIYLHLFWGCWFAVSSVLCGLVAWDMRRWRRVLPWAGGFIVVGYISRALTLIISFKPAGFVLSRAETGLVVTLWLTLALLGTLAIDRTIAYLAER